ncbi:hypothetical protein F4801DRAFT_485854 [Xylaria longipes]|nr:hypothetical protein F4801DRAFT_485854 [Xylaria longipes]RYC54691.1 hypothetical protein CHU98_g11518 [Xylaria longipes]
MSRNIPPDYHTEPVSCRNNDTGEGYDYEDAFTAGRPQYNDSNLPQTVVQDLMLLQMQGSSDHYPASCRTDSTATILADKAAATAAATSATTPTRDYILYHVNRDYNGAVEQLTEQAVAALNNDFRNGSYNGNVGEWVRDRSQFPPSDPVDLNLSVLRSPPTRTDSTVGSSWTIISSATPSDSQEEYMADDICAAGGQFVDVPASPTGPTLSDEDCI